MSKMQDSDAGVKLLEVAAQRPEGYDGTCLRPLGLCELGGCCDVCWYRPDHPRFLEAQAARLPDNDRSAESNREREVKIRFRCAEDFEAVLQAAGGVGEKPACQKNHFFDTHHRGLGRARYVLRLREENDVFSIALKGPSSGSAGRFMADRAELEVVVERGEAIEILAGRLSVLRPLERHAGAASALLLTVQALLGGEQPSPLGGFENTRVRVPYRLSTPKGSFDLALEFDKTNFPGGRIDYEVELELPADADGELAAQALEELCAKAGVRGEPASSKAKRFFESLVGQIP